MKIKKLISRYMLSITCIIGVIILMVVTVLLILNEQHKAKERANDIFVEIESILEENKIELEEVKKEYSQTCLYNAEAIAYIIESDSTVLESLEELKKIAEFMEVDEIHIFDETGKIFTGTHPEYYGLTMNSGEQIGFFLPLLEDKTLQLCQDITPNTAESKPMQYSALWSEHKNFIVQVGMEPVNVLKVTEKNELSHIFNHLKVDIGVDLYAIDKVSGKIVGSTSANKFGMNCEEIGFDLDELIERGESIHIMVNGVDSYCVFAEMDGNLIGRVISTDSLYEEIPVALAEMGVFIVIIAFILAYAVIWYMNTYIVAGIYNINEKLSQITDGNLSESVDVHTTLEFGELSDHINRMMDSLLATTDKMSYVLNRTDMNIGVYEYNENMSSVRFTEFIPKILELDSEKVKQLTSDYRLFKAYLNKMRENTVSDEDKDIIKINEDKYIKIEETEQNGNIFGIIIDATNSVKRRIKLENERDRDLLTGLYNRRGLDNILAKAFSNPESLGYGALVMIDTDGLKVINDTYGHEKGDVYLRKIAGVLGSFGLRNCVSARQGGDEFVLFLYNYESEEDVMDEINTLRYIQENSSVHLDLNLTVPLSFSFGYTLIKGCSDYEDMLKIADEMMYNNKRERKQKLNQK